MFFISSHGKMGSGIFFCTCESSSEFLEILMFEQVWAHVSILTRLLQFYTRVVVKGVTSLKDEW